MLCDLEVPGLEPGYRAQFGSCGEAEWDRLLLGFDDAVLYQAWAYGAVRWGARNLDHLVISHEGRVVAAAQASLARLPALGVGVAYVAWAPLCRPKGGGPGLSAYRQILRGLRQAFTRRRGLCLRLRPQDRAGQEQEVPAILAGEGFTHQEDVEPYTTVEMDVSLPEERFHGNLARSWRQSLHRAERNDLEVREGTGPELYRALLVLYGEMKERKQFVTFVDVREMEAVQERLAEPLKMRITLCSAGQEPVAALVYSALGDTAVGILAATSGRGRELGAAYMTWKHTVGLLRERGLRRFDLGGVDVGRAPGPAQFKKGLAGKSGGLVRHIGQFDAPGSVLSRFCLSTGISLQKAYRRLRLGHKETARDAIPVGAGAGAGADGGDREEGHHG